MQLPFQVVWFNIFAAAVCMSGPMAPWNTGDPMHVVLTSQWPGRDDLLTLWSPDGNSLQACLNGRCIACNARREVPMMCRTAFDENGDGDIDLRDVSKILPSIVHCEAGRCLRMLPP